MDDFNIDFLKKDNDGVNLYYNKMTSHYFAPYVLKPSRLISNTLIDNIFINSVEYLSHSGYLTIQIADNLFQFIFFKDLLHKKFKLYERNLKFLLIVNLMRY